MLYGFAIDYCQWLPRIKHHFPEARIILIGEDVGRRRDGTVKQALQTVDGIRLANRIGAIAYLEWECELPNVGVEEIAGAIAWAAAYTST